MMPRIESRRWEVEVVYNVIHLITSPSQQVLTQLAATVIVRARLIPRLFRRQTP